jgi:hypothetical protein
MVRSGALVVAMLVLFSGLAAGYLAGTRVNGDAEFEQWEAQKRTAANFYGALSTLDQDSPKELLGNLLAPEFTDQRLDVQQTLGRADFLRVAVQEARTFPHRQLVPVSMSSDRGWVVVLVKTVDSVPGQFGGIPLPASERSRQELLHVQDGQISGRVVMEETGSMLRSFEPVSLWSAEAGTKTLKIGRHDFDAYASERPAFPVDTLVVVDIGRFSILMEEMERTLEAGEALLVPADRAVTITNETDAPGRLFALFAAPIEQPGVDTAANQTHDVAPGVVVSIVAQTQHFVPGAGCLMASPGFAVMAPGERLPLHQTTGYELILPTSGTVEVRSQNHDFLRTDSVRQWQDELPFAALEQGLAVAAPAGSWMSAVVTSQEPATFWVFTVETSGRCSSSEDSSMSS